MNRRLISFVLVILALLTVGVAGAANRYDVTEEITITWWHAHEDQWIPFLNHMVEQFHAQQDLIKVEPVYIGPYAEINTQLIAAVASGDVPALCTANTSYPAVYGAAGICEILDPYIEAYDFDIADFGEGLIKSSSYAGEQVSLPYLISTQVMYYNQDMADEEGIEMPKTFADFEAFLEKATLFNEDGTTKRFGTVIGGWDYWYYEMLYKNNGVWVLRDDETTDVNSEQAIYITSKIKEWIDKGYAYYAYGTGASANMRQLFWDGGAFSVFHTSSLYDTYVVNSDFTVGMAWLPGSEDGTSFLSEVGGAVILIPAGATQRQKNAAWQFLMFMASPDINLYWADQTGYFPTRASVMQTPEYEEYLNRKPAMRNIVAMGSWINPRNQHPAYDTIANLWRHALARIFNEGAPVEETLNDLAQEIEEIIEDF